MGKDIGTKQPEKSLIARSIKFSKDITGIAGREENKSQELRRRNITTSFRTDEGSFNSGKLADRLEIDINTLPETRTKQLDAMLYSKLNSNLNSLGFIIPLTGSAKENYDKVATTEVKDFLKKIISADLSNKEVVKGLYKEYNDVTKSGEFHTIHQLNGLISIATIIQETKDGILMGILQASYDGKDVIRSKLSTEHLQNFQTEVGKRIKEYSEFAHSKTQEDFLKDSTNALKSFLRESFYSAYNTADADKKMQKAQNAVVSRYKSVLEDIISFLETDQNLTIRFEKPLSGNEEFIKFVEENIVTQLVQGLVDKAKKENLAITEEEIKNFGSLLNDATQEVINPKTVDEPKKSILEESSENLKNGEKQENFGSLLKDATQEVINHATVDKREEGIVTEPSKNLDSAEKKINPVISAIISKTDALFFRGNSITKENKADSLKFSLKDEKSNSIQYYSLKLEKGVPSGAIKNGEGKDLSKEEQIKLMQKIQDLPTKPGKMPTPKSTSRLQENRDLAQAA